MKAINVQISLSVSHLPLCPSLSPYLSVSLSLSLTLSLSLSLSLSLYISSACGDEVECVPSVRARPPGPRKHVICQSGSGEREPHNADPASHGSLSLSSNSETFMLPICRVKG